MPAVLNGDACPKRSCAPRQHRSTARGVISHGHVNHAAYVACVSSFEHKARGGRRWMHSVTGEYRWLEPKRVVGRNSLPHFPVQRIAQLGPKAAKTFINSSSNHDSHTLNGLTCGDRFMPVVKQAHGFPMQFGYTCPMSF